MTTKLQDSSNLDLMALSIIFFLIISSLYYKIHWSIIKFNLLFIHVYIAYSFLFKKFRQGLTKQIPFSI